MVRYAWEREEMHIKFGWKAYRKKSIERLNRRSEGNM